jgi:glycosyltransferase involved in cell wall biosynthesis
MVKRLTSILVPVMNEVDSLNKTCEIIFEQNPKKEFEIIVILSPRSSEDSIGNAFLLQSRYVDNISVITQKYPGLGGAYAHGIEIASGSHLIMIASDLETDPNLVHEMLRLSNENPNTIITTTRWKGEGAGFESYGKFKLTLNWIFQRSISSLYASTLTDFTFGYRLYPIESIRGIVWKNRDFAFLLESILVPIKNDWSVMEISHMWKPRSEGISTNQRRFFLAYFITAIKLRFTP